MKYNWKNRNWPHFTYDLTAVQERLYDYAVETGILSAKFTQLAQEAQLDALIDLMVVEAINSSEIEGETFNAADVRSSIKRELGLSKQDIKDKKAAGIGKLMVDVQKTFKKPLTRRMLFDWQKMVMGSETSGWRTGSDAMQILSGGIGREVIHFEAPPSEAVESLMAEFIGWFNATDPIAGQTRIAGPVRAAIAHVYFESIHPFDDGNGRVGRAIAEKALSQELQYPTLLSLSVAIKRNRKEYYRELSHASGPSLDITQWVAYFVHMIQQAQSDAKKRVAFVLTKARFWVDAAGKLNERQEKVLKRMFEAGITGFEGRMTASKYMKIAKCAKATATRDLAELLEQKRIKKMAAGGRSTGYEVDLATY